MTKIIVSTSADNQKVFSVNYYKTKNGRIGIGFDDQDYIYFNPMQLSQGVAIKDKKSDLIVNFSLQGARLYFMTSN